MENEEFFDDMLFDDFDDNSPIVGDVLAPFTLEAYQKGEIIRVDLGALTGKWLAIVFYPADFTFVCPTELSELADLYPEFQKEGAEVLSVSTDTVYTHKAWHDTSDTIKKIAFPMVADPAGKLAKYLGVYLSREGLALRGSFIVNPEGVIVSAEINDNSIGRSAKELLRKLRAAKFVAEHNGQVCPASWEPGDDTLTPGLDLVGKI